MKTKSKSSCYRGKGEAEQLEYVVRLTKKRLYDFGSTTFTKHAIRTYFLAWLPSMWS